MSKVIHAPVRGSMNERAAAFYLAATQRELTIRELRLLPFINYTVQNGGLVAARSLNPQELAILNELNDAGWIILQRGSSGYKLAVTESFWRHMNYVLFICYVVQAVDAEGMGDAISD